MAIKKATTTPKPATKGRVPAGEGKKSSVPLIVEPHPKDYAGFPFITLIQYRKAPMLVIVDNADDEVIRAYVLDLCGPEHVNEEVVIQAATEWYTTNRGNYPISIEFSRRGMTPMTSRVYRALNIEFVSRIIGPVPKYPMGTVKSIKRRRRKPIPPSVEMSTRSSAEQFFEE
jgi:hypothetical protein